jgi:acyl-CoA thioester hydrolase
MRSESDGRLIAEGYGVLVGYDYAAEEARPVPDELRRKLEPQLVG